jgi:SAM-dependent MidA family methyltransferase
MRPDPLVSDVIHKILETRDLAFEEFMALALYHEPGGYYRRAANPVGESGDFVTSPALSPVFSFALSRLVDEFVRRATDGVCSVVDIGCGDGSLIHSVWEQIARHHPAVRCFGVDQSVTRVPYQRRQSPVSFVTSLGEVPSTAPALVFSNELFDAIPFARLVRREDGLHELCVTRTADGALSWSERPAEPAQSEYFESRGLALEVGQFADVSLRWGTFYGEIVRHFPSALVVTFDYGHDERALFRGRARRYGTAVAYRRHQATRDLLADPGEQDLTAHINFTDLMRAGEREGAQTLFFDSQAMFLLKIGAAAHPLLAPVEDGTRIDPREAMDVITARDAAKRLILPDGPGVDVRVLVQARTVPMDGWSFQRSFAETFT